jgi:hypothetical protein
MVLGCPLAKRRLYLHHFGKVRMAQELAGLGWGSPSPSRSFRPLAAPSGHSSSLGPLLFRMTRRLDELIKILAFSNFSRVDKEHGAEFMVQFPLHDAMPDAPATSSLLDHASSPRNTPWQRQGRFGRVLIGEVRAIVHLDVSCSKFSSSDCGVHLGQFCLIFHQKENFGAYGVRMCCRG